MKKILQQFAEHEEIINFQNVSKRYTQGEEALKDINFSLKFSEMAFLTGHSGAGKSTLLKLIAAMERPTGGEIIVAGQSIGHLARRGVSSLRQSLGMVFQDPNILDRYTVFENVALPLLLQDVRQRDIASRVRAALDVVGLLAKEKRYPYKLSVGERQRVGIARAIVNHPPLLLADEPTGNLDPDLAREIMDLFTKLNETGMSLLIATHDLSLIASRSNRILTLKEGHLIS